jgi:membrane protease YdiL (CAAX protease family)
MRFVQLGQKGINNFGSIFLTIAAVVFVFFVTQIISLFLALSLSKTELTSSNLDDLITNLGANTFLAIQLIPFLFALVTLLICIKFLHKRSILTVFTSRKNIDWKRFLFSTTVWFLIMGANLFIAIWFSDTIQWHFNFQTFIPLLFISLILIPIQTTCEEVLFRGYLLQLFGSSYRLPWLAIIITSILFGLIHAGNPEIDYLGYIALIYYILTGVFLSVVGVMDEGLELSMGYHAANNIFGAIILTNTWQAFQTDAMFIDNSKPTFGLEMVLSLIVIQPLLIFIFAKVYKWRDWKKKLFQPLNSSNFSSDKFS